jgi:hypothetical protein
MADELLSSASLRRLSGLQSRAPQYGALEPADEITGRLATPPFTMSYAMEFGAWQLRAHEQCGATRKI